LELDHLKDLSIAFLMTPTPMLIEYLAYMDITAE